MKRACHWFICLLFACLLVVGCSSITQEVPIYPTPLLPCVSTLVDFKQHVKKQRATDAQLLWSQAYPHLAFDRFSLSLVNKLNTTSDRRQWLSYVTRQATEQRHIEFQNLTDKQGMGLKQLDNCADLITQASLEDEDFWYRLQSSPPVYPSDYLTWHRTLGLYPITKQFLRPLIRDEKLRIQRGYLDPADDNAITYAIAPSLTTQASKLTVTEPDPQHEQFYQTFAEWFAQARTTSNLSWPLLSEKQALELLHFFAPQWRIETAGLDDKPGLVRYDSKSSAWVDPWEPALYSYLSYTRFQGQILPQLNYMIWFANRTATSRFDPYAGRFDSVLIRLTLDRNGKPYVIDSIHSCGCYHMVFSLNPALSFAKRDPDTEQPIRMQLGEYSDLKIPFTVTLSAGDHMVKGLGWHPLNEHKQLTMLPYRQLRSLTLQSGHNKSLFDIKGMLMASQRPERWFLWPFGVKSPGAMRQRGHHAIVFIGERHFDDAFIFDSLFLAE